MRLSFRHYRDELGRLIAEFQMKVNEDTHKISTAVVPEYLTQEQLLTAVGRIIRAADDILNVEEIDKKMKELADAVQDDTQPTQDSECLTHGS
jgi:hypothetical protein